MDTLTLLWNGIAVAMQPGNLLFAGIGVLLGTLVGILPGISPSLTVALLLPVTFKLDPTGSIIMFAGIYFGAMYGSSTTAILLNTPGEAASIATAIEGQRPAVKKSIASMVPPLPLPLLPLIAAQGRRVTGARCHFLVALPCGLGLQAFLVGLACRLVWSENYHLESSELRRS